MTDKIKINLQLADMTYPMTIDRKEEAMVREAAKQVNKRLSAYREHYPTLGSEQLMAVVAYHFSLEKLQWMQRKDTAPFLDKLAEWDALLEETLNEQ
ncbi:MAG: cell division protein ZapA [Bacteroides sp.]|nr:cell division protein ZapA [Bacteroides sp.]